MWSEKSKADVLQEAEAIERLAAALHARVRFGDGTPEEAMSILAQLRERVKFAESAASWDAWTPEQLEATR